MYAVAEHWTICIAQLSDNTQLATYNLHAYTMYTLQPDLKTINHSAAAH